MSSPITPLVTGLQGVQGLGQDLQALAGALRPPFLARLKRASFRGVPFGVIEGEAQFGRRVAVHEYPFRDKPWIEDLGRGTRRIGLTGFLVEDSAIYGGGDVMAQRDQMVAAAETANSGTLVHPTLGQLTVSLETITVHERWDAGRYFELRFSFYEAGQRVFPSASTQSTSNVLAQVSALVSAAAADFAAALQPLLQGVSLVSQALATVKLFGAQIQTLGADATSLLGLASSLGGPYGRYFNGANEGPFGSNLVTGTATLDDLVQLASANRTAIVAASAQLQTDVGNLGSSATPAGVGADVAALATSLGAACADPADAIRLLSDLAGYAPNDPNATSAVGQVLAAMFSRATLAALAQATSAYQPSSYTDAANVRSAVLALFDTAITAAGDAGDDASYDALQGLAIAVAQDLSARGGSLAPIVTFTFGTAMPSLWLAQRLYQDPTREDELVTQANPVHPMFTGPSFQALAQ